MARRQSPSVIPAIPPEIRGNPPFLALLASSAKLKACLVTGKDKVMSVTLFDAYRPCSANLAEIMRCAMLVRIMPNRTHTRGQCRLSVRNPGKVGHPPMDDQALEAAFALHAGQIDAKSEATIPLLVIPLLIPHAQNPTPSAKCRLHRAPRRRPNLMADPSRLSVRQIERRPRRHRRFRNGRS